MPKYKSGLQKEIEIPKLHPLEKNMGRRQSKKTLNNRKTIMTPTEDRESTPARSEKHNTEEEEETDLKTTLF